MKILLPTSLDLVPDLPDGVVGVPYDVRQEVPTEHRDAEALVVWGNPAARLREAARDLVRLRWVQGLMAGPDALFGAGFDPRVVITAGQGLHDQPVAEHALALVLAGARRLDLAVRAQIGHRWARELGGMQPPGNATRFATLRDAQVVVWGFGSIAQTLAPLLAGLGARVTGIARTPGERGGFPVVEVADLPRVLPTADVLVSLLPSTSQTVGAVGAEVLNLLPDRAWVVNVGRGSTLDEEALVEALRGGRLAGAALDVTATEPLPADSPLWDAPNVIITPHGAGGRPVGSDRLIAHNVRALLARQPMRNVVG